RFAEASAAAGVDPTAIRSKLDEDLGGRPVLQRTVELFANHADVTSIIVAGPHEPDAFEAFKTRYGDKLGLLGVRLVRGGKTHRYETVAAALQAVPEGAELIAVHDAARPCTPVELLDAVFDAARAHGAAIPAVDVSDTLKRVAPEPLATAAADPMDAILGLPSKPSLRAVGQTVDRAGLVAVQTPQVFRAEVLRAAYAQEDLTSTDDAQLVERLGTTPIAIVPGDVRNIKITRPDDLALARSILNIRAPEGGSLRPAHKRF
nr:2-C-methyl-D-erythritol 4-phosphate cytidylyltransferase [Phycisphaerales bacterium]